MRPSKAVEKVSCLVICSLSLWVRGAPLAQDIVPPYVINSNAAIVTGGGRVGWSESRVRLLPPQKQTAAMAARGGLLRRKIQHEMPPRQLHRFQEGLLLRDLLTMVSRCSDHLEFYHFTPTGNILGHIC